MEKKYAWKISLSTIAFLLSIVSASAEINGAIMIDCIASICYIVALSIFIYVDFSLSKDIRFKAVNKIDVDQVRGYDDLVKIKKSQLRKRSSLFLSIFLLVVVIVGIIVQYSDVNIIVKNAFDVLFALGLMIKTMIDKAEFYCLHKQ